MNIHSPQDRFDFLHSHKEVERTSKRNIKASNSFFEKASPHLAIPDPILMRIGKAGGLPFDTLSSDVVTGCLPKELACYGTCFAALSAYKAGYDFGKRIANIFDADVLQEDLSKLSPEQGYLRNGWNSDPSWDWDKAIDLASLTAAAGKLLIFISKCFRLPTDTQIDKLIKAHVEIRLSMSAFDDDAYLKHRLDFMEKFRAKGGHIIALIITTKFKDPAKSLKQDGIVDYLCRNDFLGAENSLRVNACAKILESLDVSKMAPLRDSTDMWCGRLYETQLRLPTTTSVPFSYKGLQSPFLSGNDPDFIENLFFDPVPTHADVMGGVRLKKPQQCGIGLQRTVAQ